jgi:16S rRNA (guanine527-N7)-methyltransferase
VIDRDAFAAMFDVPRGTMAKFDIYASLLVEWQTRMNLVAPSTLATVWDRHFADSAQLAALAGSARMWLDLGSGAGFPALVLALLMPTGYFHLVEATSKKCRFLAEVASALDLTDRVTVHNCRIEVLPPFSPDVITARACAGLSQLFEWGLPHGQAARWLLLKGKTAAAEVATASTMFAFDHILIASRTDPDARIVDAQRVRRRG